MSRRDAAEHPSVGDEFHLGDPIAKGVDLVFEGLPHAGVGRRLPTLHGITAEAVRRAMDAPIGVVHVVHVFERAVERLPGLLLDGADRALRGVRAEEKRRRSDSGDAAGDADQERAQRHDAGAYGKGLSNGREPRGEAEGAKQKPQGPEGCRKREDGPGDRHGARQRNEAVHEILHADWMSFPPFREIAQPARQLVEAGDDDRHERPADGNVEVLHRLVKSEPRASGVGLGRLHQLRYAHGLLVDANILLDLVAL